MKTLLKTKTISSVTERNFDRRPEIVYSTKVKAGKKRTYFFDVKKTRGNDYYITITESTRRPDGEGYNRHKVFLYKEDFNRFLEGLEEVINHIKTDLLPDYDYDEFTRRHEEWEARVAEEDAPYEKDKDLPSEDDIEW